MSISTNPKQDSSEVQETDDETGDVCSLGPEELLVLDLEDYEVLGLSDNENIAGADLKGSESKIKDSTGKVGKIFDKDAIHECKGEIYQKRETSFGRSGTSNKNSEDTLRLRDKQSPSEKSHDDSKTHLSSHNNQDEKNISDKSKEKSELSSTEKREIDKDKSCTNQNQSKTSFLSLDCNKSCEKECSSIKDVKDQRVEVSDKGKESEVSAGKNKSNNKEETKDSLQKPNASVIHKQKSVLPASSSAASKKPKSNVKTSGKDVFPSVTKVRWFQKVILVADNFYEKLLRRFESSRVRGIYVENLTVASLTDLIKKNKEGLGKNVLWILISGIKAVCYCKLHIHCKNCQYPFFHLVMKDDFKIASTVDSAIKIELQTVDSLFGEIQKELSDSGVMAIVPPVPTSVVQQNFLSHHFLHNLSVIESAPVASEYTLQQLQIIYNKFCKAWTTMAFEKLKSWIDPSIFQSFRSSAISSNILPISDWDNYSYIIASWIQSVTLFLDSILTRNFPLEKAKWMVSDSLVYDRVVVVGHPNYIGKLKSATKKLQVIYVSESVDLDENGLAVLCQMSKKWPKKTLWLIMVGISELAVPSTIGLPNCVKTSCPNPLPAFIVKNHPLGDKNFMGVSNSEMIDRIVGSSVDFAISVSKKLESSSALFLVPLIPQRAISTKIEAHDYFHENYAKDPTIPFLIGQQHEWKENIMEFENKWFNMIKKFIPEGSLLRKLFDEYILEKEPVFDFINSCGDMSLVHLRKKWASFMLKIVKYFLNLKESEKLFSFQVSSTLSQDVPMDKPSSNSSVTDLKPLSREIEEPSQANQTSQVPAETSESKKGHIIIQNVQTDLDYSQVSTLLNLFGKMLNMEWPLDEEGQQGGFIMATFEDEKKCECATRILNFLKVFGEKSNVKNFGSKGKQDTPELENEDMSLLLSIHDVLGNLRKKNSQADGPEKGLNTSKSDAETSITPTVSKMTSNKALHLPNAMHKNEIGVSLTDIPLPKTGNKNLSPCNSDVLRPASKPRSSPFKLEDIPLPGFEKDKVKFDSYNVTVSNITSFIPLNTLGSMFKELGALKDEVKGKDCVVYNFKSNKAELKLLHGYRFPDKKMHIHITGPDSDIIFQKSEIIEASKRLKGPLLKVMSEVQKAVKEHIKKEVNVYTFKTKSCKFGDQCLDKERCHGYHNMEDRRRCPMTYKYSSETCSKMDTKGFCENKDYCLKIHSSQERLLHFNFYKSTVCPFASAKISCEKMRRICHSVHKGMPDMFYHNTWENLYVEGLGNTTDFLAGAIRNLFKIPNLKCPRVLLVTPSPMFAKFCCSYIKELALSCEQNVFDLEGNDKASENSSVIISTVQSILPILSMKSVASEKLDLSGLKAIIFDDCPTVFEDFPETSLEIFNTFAANGVNVVVTAEKISQSDVAKAKKHLLLRTLTVSCGTQEKLTDAAKAIDSQEKVSLPVSRQDNQRSPSRSSQLSLMKSLRDDNSLETLPGTKLKKRYASPPKSSDKRMKGDQTSSRSDSYSKAKSSSSSSSRSSSSDKYRKRYDDDYKREFINKERKRRVESDDDRRRESHQRNSDKKDRKKSRSRSNSDQRKESRNDVNDPVWKRKVSEKDDIVKRADSCERQRAEVKFLAAVKEMKEECDRELELYTETPEVHPYYEEKYGFFIEKYQKEFPGKNDMVHCEKLWLVFWKETVKELLSEEYKIKMEGLRKEHLRPGKQHESMKQKYGLDKTNCREKNIVPVNQDVDLDLGGLLQLKSSVQTPSITSSEDSEVNSETLNIRYTSSSQEDISQESFQSAVSDKMQAFEKKRHVNEENLVKTDSLVQVQQGRVSHQLVSASPKSEEFISLDSMSVLKDVCPAVGLLRPALELLIENLCSCWSDKSKLCKLLQNPDNEMVLKLVLVKCEKLNLSASSDSYAQLYQKVTFQVLKLLEYPQFYLKEKEKMHSRASVRENFNPPLSEQISSTKFSYPSHCERESFPKDPLKSKVDSEYCSPSSSKMVGSTVDQSKPESLTSAGHHLVRNEEFLLVDNRFDLLEEVCPHLGLLGSVALMLIQNIRKNLTNKAYLAKLIQDKDNKVILEIISENSKKLSKTATSVSSREKFEAASKEALRLLDISESYAQNQKYFGLDIDEIAKITYNKDALNTVNSIKSALATAGITNATEDDIIYIYEAVATIHLGMTL